MVLLGMPFQAQSFAQIIISPPLHVLKDYVISLPVVYFIVIIVIKASITLSFIFVTLVTIIF